MVKLENVVKSYDRKTNAVDGVSLDIRDGEIFGFLGCNGAGKTTCINMITGIIGITSGSISVNGYDVAARSVETKRCVGYVPDDPNVFLRLTGMEYLNFMADMFGVSAADRAAVIKDLAARFELTGDLGSRIQSYSHGMRQKAVIIGSLLHDPDVWVLDEPMTGLDPKSSFVLKEIMRARADAGKTVLFSTHILDTAEKICDRVAIIDKGRILFCGTLPEMREHLRNNESLEQMFLEITDNR